MRKKLLCLGALALVAQGPLPASAVIPLSVDGYRSHSPSGPSPMPGMDNMPGMEPGDMVRDEPSDSRPLKPVLGAFGVGTSAVLLGAGFLRRKDRARSEARAANIASRRNRK